MATDFSEYSGFNEVGSGSVTVSGIAGAKHHVTKVYGWFESTGPATGTLKLKEGSTVVWEATVEGGLEFGFPGRWIMGSGEDVTLELTGGKVRIIGGTADA